MEIENKPLSLYTADELIAELSRRSDAILVAVGRKRKDDESEYIVWDYGQPMLYHGLLWMLRRKVNDAMAQAW